MAVQFKKCKNTLNPLLKVVFTLFKSVKNPFQEEGCMQNLLFIFLFVFSFSSYSEETIVDASSQGDLKQVNHLISSGADVNAKDDGETALMLAVRGNHSKIDRCWF